MSARRGWDHEITGNSNGFDGGFGGDENGAEAEQGQAGQMGAASDVGQHAAAAGARTGTDEPKVKANDKAYNSALKNLPNKQYDPWRGVR